MGDESVCNSTYDLELPSDVSVEIRGLGKAVALFILPTSISIP